MGPDYIVPNAQRFYIDGTFRSIGVRGPEGSSEKQMSIASKLQSDDKKHKWRRNSICAAHKTQFNAPHSFKFVLRMRHAFRLVVRLVVAGQLSRETSHFAIEMFVSK